MSNVRVNGSFIFQITPMRLPRPAPTAEKFVVPPQREQRDTPPAPKRPPAASGTAPKSAASTHPAPSCRTKHVPQPASQRREHGRQSETAQRPASPGAAALESERGALIPNFQFDVFRSTNGNYDGLEPESPGFSFGPTWNGWPGGEAGEWVAQAPIAALEPTLFETEALLAELLSIGKDDGIFEVILPGGQTLGIAVQSHGAEMRLLLSAADERFSARLKRQRTELEDALERRMERGVSIVVL